MSMHNNYKSAAGKLTQLNTFDANDPYGSVPAAPQTARISSGGAKRFNLDSSFQGRQDSLVSGDAAPASTRHAFGLKRPSAVPTSSAGGDQQQPSKFAFFKEKMG